MAADGGHGRFRCGSACNRRFALPQGKFAGQFVDTFRFLNQLGTLARKGVKVVMHNTLASSDYGLLDEETLEPRPNYWAAVLWTRTMGTTVLDSGTQNGENLRIYAHCLKQNKGGVALIALNTDATQEQTLAIPWRPLHAHRG